MPFVVFARSPVPTCFCHFGHLPEMAAYGVISLIFVMARGVCNIVLLKTEMTVTDLVAGCGHAVERLRGLLDSASMKTMVFIAPHP
ncbi:hypothetical protein Nepgr_017946 [Nepenthes gracilis]|uniref:Uncharacterized protein n=1 Tax=Nepenthes gracilis TaxID=150966 RepID=A0AAD3SSD9_NEPGR|nr:hypothetical protein Nepgr_017946 [Nepenthes gracilis]